MSRSLGPTPVAFGAWQGQVVAVTLVRGGRNSTLLDISNDDHGYGSFYW